jgi:glucan phosphoethanolaminetransferase (alkaline phosphatase superfamily)
VLLPKIIKMSLITIESYSADFMKAYGNEQNITPFLDSLATQSLLLLIFMLQEIEQCEV